MAPWINKPAIIGGAVAFGLVAIVIGLWLFGGGFLAHILGGLAETMLGVVVAVLLIERYDTIRRTRPWVPARNAALRAAAHQICTLIQTMQMAVYRAERETIPEQHRKIREQPYENLGWFLKECGDSPSDEAANALHDRVDMINRVFADPWESHATMAPLALKFKAVLDLARIDRIRSLAFPLLAGTQDESVIKALNAIERATLSAFLLHDRLTAIHAGEQWGYQAPPLIKQFLESLETAYREIASTLAAQSS